MCFPCPQVSFSNAPEQASTSYLLCNFNSSRNIETDHIRLSSARTEMVTFQPDHKYWNLSDPSSMDPWHELRKRHTIR